jgi:hypothetical protein
MQRAPPSGGHFASENADVNSNDKSEINLISLVMIKILFIH